MKRIGIIAKLNKPEALKIAREVAEWLAARGVEVFVEEELGRMIGYQKACFRDKLPDLIDLLLVLGGDGTMLSAARLVGGKGIPILGVNLGGLGFLTEVTVGEMYAVLEDVVKDRFETEERMMLSVELQRVSGEGSHYMVLNDVVVKGTLARLISLETSINKEYVTTYRADGLIVATPTGSTAYSLSAGGPILYPTIHSIIVAPICPFNLTNRPVVIPDWMSVEMRLKTQQSHVLLTLDGQIDIPIRAGDAIEVKRAEASIYLVRFPGKSYFDILRARLM
ncbi:MAG: NAD(+)/NADH kinase, partial [Deltaproteobacteria bacterium]|nr:NAD(+)/NADH kinase [Deltaproteobacteria bacterium]